MRHPPGSALAPGLSLGVGPGDAGGTVESGDSPHAPSASTATTATIIGAASDKARDPSLPFIFPCSIPATRRWNVPIAGARLFRAWGGHGLAHPLTRKERVGC